MSRLLAIAAVLAALSSAHPSDARVYETTDCYTGETPAWVSEPWQLEEHERWCATYLAGEHPWQIRERRLSEAHSRLDAAAERGHLPAILAMARLWDRGRLVVDREDDLVLSFSRDRQRAADLYERAAAHGDLGALLKLAFYHRRGIGGYDRDVHRAVRIYIDVAESGDPAAGPEARIKLGWLIAKQKVRVSSATCRLARGRILELANPDNALGSPRDRRSARRIVSKWSRPCMA